jgi:hypothetical protein
MKYILYDKVYDTLWKGNDKKELYEVINKLMRSYGNNTQCYTKDFKEFYLVRL